MKASQRSPLSVVALVSAGVLSAGCAGLLGLDDKIFGDTTGGTTSDSTSDGGGGAGGVHLTGGGGTGGTDSTVTTSAGGTGGGGPIGPLSETFEDLDAGAKPWIVYLEEDLGWLFTWQEETYQAPQVFPGVFVYEGVFQFGLKKTFYWYGGLKGALMYKEIQGDFLIVTDVTVTEEGNTQTPKDDQCGAGIMIRDPSSAMHTTGNQRWVTIDRGGDMGTPSVHGSWSTPVMSQSLNDNMASPAGKVAICRVGQAISIWMKEGETWDDRTMDMLPGFPQLEMPDKVQAGLFVYAFNMAGQGSEVPLGVLARFQYIHQYDPKGACNPEGHGE